MKKVTLLFIVALLSINILISQEDERSLSEFRNEIGFDITGFVKQFVINPENYYPDDPNYIIRYRRSYSKGNLRIALGGHVSSYTDEEEFYDITLNGHSSNINFKIGWEYRELLGKNWEISYGIDIGPSHSVSKNDYINGGGYGSYLTTRTNSSIGGVLAPVFGIRYYINKRIVLSTEAALNFYWRKNTEKYEHSELPESSASLPENSSNSGSSIGVNYNQPLSLIISFRL